MFGLSSQSCSVKPKTVRDELVEALLCAGNPSTSSGRTVKRTVLRPDPEFFLEFFVRLISGKLSIGEADEAVVALDPVLAEAI